MHLHELTTRTCVSKKTLATRTHVLTQIKGNNRLTALTCVYTIDLWHAHVSVFIASDTPFYCSLHSSFDTCNTRVSPFRLVGHIV